MATEIELKARVDDPETLKNKLYDLAIFIGSFEKNDVYYTLEDSVAKYGARIRDVLFVDTGGISREAILVTCKTKEVKDGIEINDENEFEVSSDTAFRDFLLQLGFREKARKQKKGLAYNYNGINVELTEVQGLGYFIELEILLQKKDGQKINQSKEKLLAFLEEAGISKMSIESRSYTEMLMKKA